MAGYAGTGKTTVATTIARTLEADENTLYCAFTGKAACVMRQKGMPGQTIHSAIYDYETVTDPQTGKKHIVHHLKPYLPYKLIVVDEASMVGTEVAKDLLSLQIPILAIGDPGQLPPVGDRYSDLLLDPDIILDEIMRQDGGNRIPLFAQQLRKGWSPTVDSVAPGPDLASYYTETSSCVTSRRCSRMPASSSVRLTATVRPSTPGPGSCTAGKGCLRKARKSSARKMHGTNARSQAWDF